MSATGGYRCFLTLLTDLWDASMALVLKKCSRMGIPKARVFPEPVTAFPITSWPLSISGMAQACIGVGEENFNLEREERV